MLPSASDTSQEFSQQHGTGVKRWQAQQTHFCQAGGNFVDGVYIIDIYNIYTNISALCVPNVDVSPYSRKVSHKGPFMCRPFRSSCMGARVPRIPKGKDISGHCIEDGFQRHLNIRAANKELQSRKHWFVRAKLGVVPTQIHPLHSFVCTGGFCCCIQS